MLSIEKQISNFVEQQFPFFLQEEGPMFIEFVKQYYVWMETENALKHARLLPEYRDIDATTDEFLVYFKEKYLKNIQFNTAASLRQMTKRSLDLYRSKGTPRAIDLLFKVVFDTPAEVYLPGNDLFKLSSGDFYQQKYLEVVPSPNNIVYVGKQVRGLQSDATAFIERLTRKKIKGTYIEFFTISALRGHFITGEFIQPVTQGAIGNNPKIIGSLTNVDIVTASKNFVLGDIVDIASTQGVGAKGRVTGIADVTGQVEFSFNKNGLDGGFGFSTAANVYVSDQVFRVTNVTTNSAMSTTYFSDFDTISANQYGIDLYNITGTGGTDLNNFIGSHFFTYYANGSIKGEAVLQDFNVGTSNTNGQAYLTLLSGDVDCRGGVNSYFNVGNTVTANLGPLGIINLSASANVIGTSANIVLSYANSLPFDDLDIVYQIDENSIQTANGTIISSTFSGVTGNLTLGNNTGVFLKTKPIYSLSNPTKTANVTGVSMDIGVYDIGGFSLTVNGIATIAGSGNLSISNTISVFPYMTVSGNNIPVDSYINYMTIGSPNNTIVLNSPATANGTSNVTFTSAGAQFFSNTGNQLYATKYEGNVYTTATVLTESTGSLASFAIANTLANPETIEINTDIIYPYAGLAINAANYGLKPTPVINSSSVIISALNFTEKTIGTITDITGVNSGEGYNVDPIVKIVEPLIAQYDVKDIQIAITNASALFFNGEIVNQPNTGAKGIIKQGNSSLLYIRSINFENSFSNNAPNTTIVGTGSGSTAQVSAITTDVYTKSMGLNAVVSANVVVDTGSVSSLEIIDSGYGFQHRELGTFTSADGSRVGTLQMLLGTRTETNDRSRGREGRSLGYYRNRGGFLSDDKKIYDAYYYQEYSYEVRSSVTLDKYEAMLKQLLHVAGTKYFSNTVTATVTAVPTTIIESDDKYNFTIDSSLITIDSTLYTGDTTYIAGYTG